MTDEELNDRFDAAFEASHGRQIWKPTMRERINAWLSKRAVFSCLLLGYLSVWIIVIASVFVIVIVNAVIEAR